MLGKGKKTHYTVLEVAQEVHEITYSTMKVKVELSQISWLLVILMWPSCIIIIAIIEFAMYHMCDMTIRQELLLLSRHLLILQYAVVVILIVLGEATTTSVGFAYRGAIVSC